MPASRSMKRLRAAQKPPHGTAAYSRFINRPLGRVIAVGAFHANLTPNTVSLVSGGFTGVGVVLVALTPPNLSLSILIGILLILGYAIDSADGQVARLTGRSSALGEWLDHILDAVKMQSVHLAVLVHLYRSYDGISAWLLAVPIAFSIVSNVLYFGMMLIDQMRRRRGGSGNMPGPHSLSVIRSIVKLPFDYGALAVVMLTLFWRDLFLGLYSLLLIGTFIALSAAILKWVRELKEIDGEVRSGGGAHR